MTISAATGSICAKVLVQPIGSVTNGQIKFGKMANPNKLMIVIVQMPSYSIFAMDTIRMFTVGQTFSKVYANLPAGHSYLVGAGTSDSTMFLQAINTNVTISVNANEVDTANIPDLLADCVYFGAKFALCPGAVKFESFVQTLNTDGATLPTYTDSLIIPKGNADTLSITDNLYLAAATKTSASRITYFNIRLRAYDSAGVVLSEGNATNVAISPGGNVTYVADMAPVTISASSLSKKAILRK